MRQIGPSEPDRPAGLKVGLETGFQLSQELMGNVELDGFFEVPPQVREFELNDRAGENQSVLADLSIKPDVKCEGAQSVVAVGYSNEWAEYVGAAPGRNTRCGLGQRYCVGQARLGTPH
jgi:hypothetical protein